jgi:hypothetical protein
MPIKISDIDRTKIQQTRKIAADLRSIHIRVPRDKTLAEYFGKDECSPDFQNSWMEEIYGRNIKNDDSY